MEYRKYCGLGFDFFMDIITKAVVEDSCRIWSFTQFEIKTLQSLCSFFPFLAVLSGKQDRSRFLKSLS